MMPLYIARVNKWGLTRGKLYKGKPSNDVISRKQNFAEYFVSVENDEGDMIDVPHEYFKRYPISEEHRDLDLRVAHEIMGWNAVHTDADGVAVGEPELNHETEDVIPAYTSDPAYNTEIFWNLSVDERVEFMRLAIAHGLVPKDLPWFEQLDHMDCVQVAMLALEIRNAIKTEKLAAHN